MLRWLSFLLIQILMVTCDVSGLPGELLSQKKKQAFSLSLGMATVCPFNARKIKGRKNSTCVRFWLVLVLDGANPASGYGAHEQRQTRLDQGVDSSLALPSESWPVPRVDLMRPRVAEIHPASVCSARGQELRGH